MKVAAFVHRGSYKEHLSGRLCACAILGSLAACPLMAQPSPPAATMTLLEAVQSALLNNPTLKVQQAQVGINRGIVLQASALFDTTLQAGASQNRLDTPLPTSDQQALDIAGEVTDTTLVSAEGTKLFRNGIGVSGTYALERLHDSYTTPLGINVSQTTLNISFPLLRGRGRDVVAAQESSDRVEVEASLLDLNQLVSQLITQTATDYWNVQAAQQNVVIAKDAEERGVVYVDNVKAFIQADHVPRSDLNEVTANLANRTANRIAAEQALVAARSQLALDIGFGAYEMIVFPQISETFPSADDKYSPANDPGSLRFYIDESLKRRADALAAQKRINEATILKTAAANARLPQLNLNLGAGYILSKQGRSAEDFFQATVSGVVAGPSFTGGVTFSFPPANDAAHGQYLQANESVKQAQLRSFDTNRTISSQLMAGVENVRTAIQRVQKARESVQSYRAALEGERDKYRAGLSSVVSVLTVEDSLTNALIDEVQADQTYAISIVQFRFLTGTLVDAARPAQDVTAGEFSTLPFYSQPTGGKS
jgi:outer membrane protein